MELETEVRKAYTFSPGPSSLPLGVLNAIEANLYSYQGGLSSMELHYTSDEFKQIIKSCADGVRKLLDVPVNYEVILSEGGAHLQNSAVPLNFLGKDEDWANYLVTGFWGNRTYLEAKRLSKINLVVKVPDVHDHIPDPATWKFQDNAVYFHYTDNETIFGLEFRQPPKVPCGFLVADMTSNLGCKPVDWSKFGAIYCASQKNLGSAGCCITVVRSDLINNPHKQCPSVYKYKNYVDNQNIVGTPATFPIFCTNKYLEYLNSAPQGILYWERLAIQKSNLIWDVVDASHDFYHPVIKFKEQRSRNNITFRIGGGDDNIENLFLEEATKLGMIDLKGHPSTKGVRVSIYNGTQVDAVKRLKDFMLDFQDKHKK